LKNGENKRFGDYKIPVLTKNEKFILTIKKSDVDSKKKNYRLIRDTSKVTDTINLTACKIYPVVTRVTLGSVLNVINYDSSPHVLETDKAHKVRIPANSRVTIKADFGHGAGLYSWVCDGSNNPLIGMIIVDN
jgi:hypothetical protein